MRRLYTLATVIAAAWCVGIVGVAVCVWRVVR